MNKIVNKFLLAGHKIMPEMHLKQLASLDKSRFAYSVCGSLTKNKEKIRNNKETEDSRCVYRKELGKTYFQHYMA